MSNPRLETLRVDIKNAFVVSRFGNEEDAESIVREFELLLELEFLQRLADA